MIEIKGTVLDPSTVRPNPEEGYTLAWYDGPMITYEVVGNDHRITINTDWNEEAKVQTWTFAYCSRETVAQYIKAEISLRKVLELSTSIQLLDFCKTEVVKAMQVKLEDIPEDYLPTHDAFLHEGDLPSDMLALQASLRSSL